MLNRKFAQWLRGLWVMAWLLTACMPTATARTSALVLTLDGPLTVGFSVYLERNLSQAARAQAPLVILQVNTPGGEISVMEKVVASIRNSPVPVVVYVTPRGAWAGSAGAVITLAGHAAVMSPETVIGAASPIAGDGSDIGGTLETKIREALKATMRALAERRGPEAVALAEAMIDDAKAVTVAEALEVNLVDFRATDLQDLLQQLDGRAVVVKDQPQHLNTQGLELTERPFNFIESVLNIVTNSNVVYLLLAAGGLLILNEISTPGGWMSGALGIVCVAVAVFGLGLLPVNWLGLIFIGLAFVLFIMDLTATSHGLLTAAAVASFIVGALVLFNSPGTPEFAQVNVPLVVGVALAMGGAFLGLLFLALRAQRQPVLMGVQQLVGQRGEMRSGDAAQVGGELWTVEVADSSATPLTAGQKVIVTAIKGLKLVVKKEPEAGPGPSQ